MELQKIVSQIELYQALGGGANLDVPTAIPVPHKNLVQLVNLPASTNKAKAVNAIEAASSARVASPQEAGAIKQAQAKETASFEPTAVVDVNDDGTTDAAVGVITEKTTFDTSTETVPVTQIVEP